MSGVKCVSQGDWTVLSAPTPTSYGYELINIDRKALPEIGTAEFRYCAGLFPGVTRVDPPDLHRKEVRIQLSNDGGTTWVTKFWGHVDSQEDQLYPGSLSKSGIRIYRVVDGFARALKWILDRVGYAGQSKVYYGGTTDTSGGDGVGAYGHPGYNYQLQSDGPVLGNKSPSATYKRNGTTVKCHIWQGAFAAVNQDPALYTANKWTEQEMIEHACVSSRPESDPEFRMRGGAVDNFSTFSPQNVNPNMSVWDFVARLVDRKRGYGVVFVDWGTNEDAFEVFLSVSSIIGETISYNVPGRPGQTGSITGAASGGTKYQFNGAYSLDLQGDNRNIDELFRYSDAETNVHDLVETLGEQIEVACTLCAYDAVGDDMEAFYTNTTKSLAPRWSTADVTAFAAETQNHRTQPYWNHVYQAFGLPSDFNCIVGQGFGSYEERIDFRCGDDGEIIAPSTTDPVDTPVNNIEILSSIPFYEGYKYSGDYPAKTDGALQYGMPSRRAPMVLLRADGWQDKSAPLTGEDYWIFPTGQYPQDLFDANLNPVSLGEVFSPSVTIHPDAIVCYSANQVGAGLRIIGDPGLDDTLDNDHVVGGLFPVTRLAFTVSLRMPWRVRMATWRSDIPNEDRTLEKVRRRRVVYVENCNLWLSASSCIYDLDGANIEPTKGLPPLRGGLDAGPYVPARLRDDRPLLARFHQLSAAWYLSPRRRLTFGMKYCGLFPFTFNTDQSGSHPTLGQYIDSVLAGGTALPVGTVVTGIKYDHQTGITVWTTDWFNLELRL